MYIILDKTHYLIQIGFTREALRAQDNGVQLLSAATNAHDDARALSLVMPFFIDRILLHPISFRFAQTKPWAFSFIYRMIDFLLYFYRLMRPIFEWIDVFVTRYRALVSSVLIGAIVLHAFLLKGQRETSVSSEETSSKKMTMIQAMNYFRETKLARRMDTEKHAFVAGEAFYYGSSQGYLVIPVTAHSEKNYSSKSIVLFSRAQNPVGFSEKRILPLQKTHCKDAGLMAYQFDGSVKAILFSQVTSDKKLRRFVLTEAVETVQSTLNLCDEYAALIENFNEL